MGLEPHWLRILAFRIMELLSDIAGYGSFYDPALDLWNIALSSFNSTDKPACPLRVDVYVPITR